MQKKLNDSQMSMWKAIIALIDADGLDHEGEIAFLKERFQKLDGTSEQKEELLSSIGQFQDVNVYFKQITEPRDRSQFIYFARLLFWSDGDFHEQEKKVLKSLNSEVMAQVDLKKEMIKLDKVVKDYESWEQSRREEQPLHRRIINALVFWEDLDSID